MIEAARIAHILGTQQALGIAALLGVLCGSYCLGVLFGLREVDGDIKLTVFGLSLPLYILCNAVAADIIGVTAELVVIVGSGDRGDSIVSLELCNDLRGTGSKAGHELCIKKVTVSDAVGNDILRAGKVQQTLEYLFKLHVRDIFRLLIIVQTQSGKDRVYRKYSVICGDKTCFETVCRKSGNVSVYHDIFPFV